MHDEEEVSLAPRPVEHWWLVLRRLKKQAADLGLSLVPNQPLVGPVS
jgi:hypothetical protein